MEVIVATQWEYCAIVSVTTGYDGWLIGDPTFEPSESNYQPSIQQFSTGNQRSKFKADNPNSLAEVISGLGSSGWELASVDQGIMYIKRPKLNSPISR